MSECFSKKATDIYFFTIADLKKFSWGNVIQQIKTVSLYPEIQFEEDIAQINPAAGSKTESNYIMNYIMLVQTSSVRTCTNN